MICHKQFQTHRGYQTLAEAFLSGMAAYLQLFARLGSSMRNNYSSH